MTEAQIDREVKRRLAILNHAEEVTGNVAMTCRYYGITRQTFYTWKRRFEELDEEGLSAPLPTRRNTCPIPVASIDDLARSRICLKPNGAQVSSRFGETAPNVAPMSRGESPFQGLYRVIHSFGAPSDHVESI